MIPWSDYPSGDYRIACPACATNPRKKDMGITVLSAEHGIAHCFKCGVIESKRPEREMSEAELKASKRRMEALHRLHEAEKRERQAKAAQAAAVRWAAALPAVDHPYLASKGVCAHGLRIEAGHTLLIPMRDSKGCLHGLQGIAPDGTKRFMPGQRVKGLYHSIGKPSGRVLIGEGFATCATLYEDSGSATAVAFNSGNLLPVAKALRSKYPCIDLVIAADDDWQTEGNPGLTAATEAARAAGGLLAVPDFSGLQRGPKDTDFNDLRKLSKAQEVTI